MCGITGFISLKADSKADLTAAIERMTRRLSHRGPDDQGIFVDEKTGVAFGHRRLSIIDLSINGRQPMTSASGRFVMVYNGEIYNYQSLARELDQYGVAWKGYSDTEVLLAGFEIWGMEKTLRKTNGMFALALWDKEKRSLFLARDRMGQKPLYYGYHQNYFFFSSEIKALKAHPSFHPEISRDAVIRFLRFSYVPTPYSIYNGIHKLTPGTSVEIPFHCLNTQQIPPPQPYWDLKEIALAGIANPFSCSEDDMVERLDRVLTTAVSRRMISDVPLGAFLSGGIDSSLIVALMQQNSARQVKTFTIGFGEKEFNEADVARAVSQALKTDHTELYLTPGHALEAIPVLPGLFDEPFADSSQIPTFLVSKMTKSHVTVALSGDGGDEMFAGYNRHFWGRYLWEKLEWFPVWCRTLCSRLLKAVPAKTWNRWFDRLNHGLPGRYRQHQAGDKLFKLSQVMTASDRKEFYYLLTSCWKKPAAVVVNGNEPDHPANRFHDQPAISDFTQWMQYIDMQTYLCDDIMTKVDRSSMGNSLEARSPFLDPEVVAFSWQVPMALKISRTEGKILLKKLLGRYISNDLIDRPKKGFGVPIDDWLRGPLREWARDLLNPRRLSNQGMFQVGPIQTMWKDHLSGRNNYQYHLWNVLMYQAWAEYYGHG